MSSIVYFVGAGPGDPELITLKGRKLLDKADIVIYAGSLVNKALLEGIEAELHDSAKLHLDQIINIMEQGVLSDKMVVRLHSGDPCFYGAIKEQMVRLDELGIDYEIVPGVSSANAAAAALKEELTRPEVTQTVIITRLAGRTSVPEKENLRSLASHKTTLMIFLSIHKIEEIVQELLEVYPQDAPVAVVYKASWTDEQIIRSTLNDIVITVKEKGINKTAIIVVGNILHEKLNAVSKLYDREFKHEYRSD